MLYLLYMTFDLATYHAI